MSHPANADPARIRQERDFYQRLLNLGQQSRLDALLPEALALIVEIGEAQQGYLELLDDREAGEPRWSIAHGLSDEEIRGVRSAISRGIIAEALASGQTITTPSALLDPRFAARESVRLGGIEAVLCAPIGQDPPRGVLYLQGSSSSSFFSDDGRARAELFARHLAPYVDSLLARENDARESDPTRPARAKLRLDGIVGRSPALAAVLEQLANVASLDVTILFTGESGTGKSQLARAIHDNGARAGAPFVHVNCAALPETLVESELFGAMPGAHSTANRRIEGKVTAAEHGTLFLDEIGDLPLSAQGKLLELLHSKQYYALGASRPTTADVRIIAATNAQLEQAVAERRFREDLFYRLRVLPIHVPSLQERREDIAALADHFCALTCSRHGFPRIALARSAERAVEAAEWPGNVRQLGYAVEAAVIRATGAGARQVEREHLFPESPASQREDESSSSFQEATRRFHARLLRDALERNDWNVVETARQLDLARSHVYNLIRAFEIQRRRS